MLLYTEHNSVSWLPDVSFIYIYIYISNLQRNLPFNADVRLKEKGNRYNQITISYLI